jgi:hypothetical protein
MEIVPPGRGRGWVAEALLSLEYSLQYLKMAVRRQRAVANGKIKGWRFLPFAGGRARTT